MSRDRAPAVPGRQVGNQGAAAAAITVGKYTLAERVQRDVASSAATEAPERVKAAAAHGTSGPPMALPHGDRIQRLFGRHDVRGVRAHVGGAAAEGAAAMGAEAFATGDQVAFGRAPDLHTAAHEAAHVVQQRAGVHLKGGVGQVGDTYEQHADAVADRVVRGESAESLLDQLSPATGHTAGGAAPVQRLAARISGKVHDITKADLHDPTAVEALFHRLELRIPSDKDGHHFVNDHRTRLNTLGAAIGRDLNWNIFMDVVGALVDGGAPDWTSWDAAEVNRAPADPAAMPGGAVQGQLKAFVEAKKHQEALDLLCRCYQPAAAVRYQVKAVSQFKLPGGQVVSNDAYANTQGAVISVNQTWIERFLLAGQVGDLLNVIEHEATHANQNRHGPGVTHGGDEDVREFEAYCREIQVTIQRCALAPGGHLATGVQFEKAVTAAEQHRANALKKKALVTRHTMQWDDIQAALPATRAQLERTDRLRNSYGADRALLGNKLAEHHELHIQLSALDFGKPDAFGSGQTLATKAEALKIPHLLARLPASDHSAAAVQRYYQEEDAFRDVVRRRVPSTAKAAPAVAASSSSLSTPLPTTSGVKIAPPPSSLGASSLLAPPKEDEGEAGWDPFGDSPAATAAAAPPPSSSASLSPTSPVSAPPPVPMLTPPPLSPASPSSQPPESSKPASPTKPAAPDDDDFGEFQSADDK